MAGRRRSSHSCHRLHAAGLLAQRQRDVRTILLALRLPFGLSVADSGARGLAPDRIAAA